MEPPMAHAVIKRMNRKPSNQGMKAHADPNTTCMTPVTTKGIFLPNLESENNYGIYHELCMKIIS